jgi:hypothetical protein
MQTSVKSQGQRGTCSIFSAVALIESMLISNELFLPDDLDLSEEWVQYIAMKGRDSDGYWSYKSWNNIFNHGIPLEADWAYDPRDWTKLKEDPLVQDKCFNDTVENNLSCLLGHRNEDLISLSGENLIDSNLAVYDPEFLGIRKKAKLFRDRYITNLYSGISPWSSSYSVYSVSEVRGNLRNGKVMTLSIPFYYGAWNHGRAETLEIGKDLQAWNLGEVGYPEKDSVDYRISRMKENKAGHSVLIVGYDDDILITTRQKMNDGTIKEFKYRGAYIFKNSWGDESFGAGSIIEPGYGLITKKYAHEFGRFYQLN